MTHLVPSDSGSGHVRLVVGAARIVLCGTDLTFGPCRLDSAEQARLRRLRAWAFGDGPEPDLAALPSGPIALWATDAWRDRPWVWWVLDALARIGREPDLWRVAPEGDGLSGLGGCGPEEGVPALDGARRVSPVEVADGRRLWALYCDASPIGLDAARQEGHVPDAWGGWFPRWDAGKLRLSILDEILLSGPGPAFVPTGSYANWDGPYGAITGPFGGAALTSRLVAWAEAGAVDRQPGPPEESPWTDQFRANGRTLALLRDGLASTADMPPLDVGGCQIGGGNPWVRVADGAGWRITERL
jgi:hypothetical protein